MSALAIALHAVSVLINRRLQRDIEEFQHEVDLRVVPPLCPVMVAPSDFGRARELIDQAHGSTLDWLSSPLPTGDQSLVLQHPHA